MSTSVTADVRIHHCPKPAFRRLVLLTVDYVAYKEGVKNTISKRADSKHRGINEMLAWYCCHARPARAGLA
jgi:hypothetical protein